MTIAADTLVGMLRRRGGSMPRSALSRSAIAPLVDGAIEELEQAGLVRRGKREDRAQRAVEVVELVGDAA